MWRRLLSVEENKGFKQFKNYPYNLIKSLVADFIEFTQCLQYIVMILK